MVQNPVVIAENPIPASPAASTIIVLPLPIVVATFTQVS